MFKHAIFHEDIIDGICGAIDRALTPALIVTVTALALRWLYGILVELPRFEQFGR